jgi:transcriptional regulator with XRE-family HTH domain
MMEKSHNYNPGVKNADDLDKRIGQKIHELRIAMGLSRHQLAERIGVTHQQTQKYEKGVNRISAGRLAQIATALNKPIGFFFDSTDNDPVLPSMQQRLCIEMSRNFMRIKNPAHREAINNLVRSLADADEV